MFENTWTTSYPGPLISLAAYFPARAEVFFLFAACSFILFAVCSFIMFAVCVFISLEWVK